MKIERKNASLVIGFIAVFIIGYIVAIKETIALKQTYDRLSQQELIFEKLPQRLMALEQKNKHFDSLLNHYQITEMSLQNNLLRMVENYAEKHPIKVEQLDQPHTFISGERTINSYALTVQGDFKSILGLAYQLEQKNKFGMISSFEVEKIKSNRTGKSALYGSFILQLVQ